MTRTKYPEYILPNILSVGTFLKDKHERIVQLQGSSEFDITGRYGFRLQTFQRVENGWIIPDYIGSTIYSRDQLQQLGLKILSHTKAIKEINRIKNEAKEYVI